MDKFTTDYVYFDNDAQEFSNANIKIDVVSDKFIIKIITENELKDVSILDILRQLNDNFMKRIRVSLVEECEIYVIDKTGTKRVEVCYGEFFIRKIIKQD